MGGENIISINVANAISITLMAVLGLFALGAARKFLGNRKSGSGVSSGPSFSGG